MELGLTLAAHMLSTLLQVQPVVPVADAVVCRTALDHALVVEPSCNIRLRYVCHLPHNRQD